ncbi:restriction endonuclease subunit S [Salibacterium aidingense]|uniref:restriction endonuclease subunit S n=1 Tax=Salibacterium aidingense TaxID=384933 RepID=UPI00040912F3|nr:restriction endonuclease subunit S [Salibacterium aidingense]
MLSNKSDWSFKTFDDICEVRKEKFNPINNPDQPYIGLEHIESGVGVINGIGSSKDTTSMKNVFKESDILLGKLRPYLKKYWYATFEGVCATEVLPLVAKQNIDEKYLFYLVQNESFINYISDRAFGTRMPRTSWNEIAEYEIQIPLKLKEQHKIAAILSSVDEAIEKTEQIIEQTETVKKGLMQQLLTKGIGHTEYKSSSIGVIPSNWDVKTLNELVVKIFGGGTPSRTVTEYYNGKIPWITVKDIEDKQEIEDSQEYISEEGLLNSSATLIPKDNLIVSTRMAVGKALKNNADVAINQDMKGIIVNNNIVETDFLLYAYIYNTDKIKRLATGTTVKGIRLEQLKQIQFRLPPKDEQLKIVSILSNLNEKLNINKRAKSRLEKLKQGLMQQLLTGKVRVPVNESEEVPS